VRAAGAGYLKQSICNNTYALPLRDYPRYLLLPKELGRNVKNMLAVFLLLKGQWAHTIEKAKSFSIL